MPEIWTAQYRYNGPDRLDITYKSTHTAGRMLAPTKQMVMDYKYGQGGQQAYIDAYRTLVHDRLVKDNSALIWVLSQQELTFVCFCRPGAFCHRVLLARDILRGVINYRGERR